MKKIPVTMMLCACLATTAITAQTFNGNEYTPEEYRAQNAYSTKWELINEEDIAWKKRVWRTIDLSDKSNELLNISSTHSSIGDVLLNGLYTTTLLPYADDRFTSELTPEDVQAFKSLRGKKVTSLKIKEDWIFLKNEKKMVVRIVAMAPVIATGGKEETPFWIYYPEARQYLAQQRIAAPGTSPGTFDEVFEGRFFASTITKVSGGDKPFPNDKRD